MTLFDAARSNWQLRLSGRLFDFTLLARKASSPSAAIYRDRSKEQTTKTAKPTEAQKERKGGSAGSSPSKKNEERVEATTEGKEGCGGRETKGSRVEQMFGKISKRLSIDDLFVDLLIIYSDAVELGVKLSLESHELMLSKK